MTDDVRHIVMCLMAIHVSFVKCLFQSTAQSFFLKTTLFVFFIIQLQKLFVYFSYRSLIRYMFCRCFLPAYRDIFLIGLFEKQKLIFLFFLIFGHTVWHTGS